MYRKILTTALVLAMVAVCASAATGDSADAASSDSPTIDHVGFLEDQTALFYFAKFADLGFSYTSGSVSSDSPTKGVGLLMNDDSVFAHLTHLSSDETYNLVVTEYADKNATEPVASVKITVDADATSAFVWFSVSEATDKVYVSGSEAVSEFNGTFSSSVGNQIYKIALSDSNDKSLGTSTVSDIANFTLFADARVVSYDGSTSNDLVNAYGLSYGFSRTKAANTYQAASKINADGFGNYVCAVFVTNQDAPSVTISSGEKSYKLTDAEICFACNAKGVEYTSGYGLAYVAPDVLAANGFNDASKVSVNIGTYSENVSSENSANGSSGGSNLALYVAIAVVVIVIAAAAVVMVKKRSIS